MKRSPLKAKKFWNYKRKPWPSHSKQYTLKRSVLKQLNESPTNLIKKDIQTLLREVVIARDGGCILRHYAEAGKCGSFRKDGELVLQAEHLNSRKHSHTFGDSRFAVCLCRHHHIHFKPQEGETYWRLVRQHVGEARWNLYQIAKADRSAHKMDWVLVKLSLEMELKKIKPSDTLM